MNTYKFKKLEVWQKAIKFVSDIYSLTSKFPASERFGLCDQLRRAAISINLNIAEGSGAGSDPEFMRFLRIAQRSAFEVIAGLEIVYNLKFIHSSELAEITEQCNTISAMLGGLIRKINSDQKSEKLIAKSE